MASLDTKVASLDTVPTEIGLYLLDFIRSTDLVAFASINKWSHILCEVRLKEYRELLAKYATIETDDYKFLHEQMTALLTEPSLAQYVRSVTIICDFDYTTLSAPSIDYAVQNGLCPEQWNNMSSSNYSQSLNASTSIMMLLPLFEEIHQLHVMFDDWIRCDLLGDIVQHNLQLIRSPASKSAQAFYALTNLVVEIFESGIEWIPLLSLLPVFGLPALQSLEAHDVTSEHLDVSNDFGNGRIPQLISRAPLQSLRFETSAISSPALNHIFQTIQPNTLRDFRYHGCYFNFGDALPSFQPRELVQALRTIALNSLETIDIETDGTYVRQSAGGRTVYSFDANTNLAGFVVLKKVVLDAELLLNGYGILDSDERVSHDGSYEPNHEEAPPFHVQLPESLQTFSTRCTKRQRIVFKGKIRQMMEGLAPGERPKGFPVLSEVSSQSYHFDPVVLWKAGA